MKNMIIIFKQKNQKKLKCSMTHTNYKQYTLKEMEKTIKVKNIKYLVTKGKNPSNGRQEKSIKMTKNSLIRQ